MKVFKAIFIFILILFAVLLFLEIIPVAPKYHVDNNPWIVEKGKRPLIIPHGGAKELYPENTIYAFRKLDESGFDVFEVDLVLTKDNKLISHHDIDLLRSTGDSEKIISLTYDEIVTKYLESNFASEFRDYNNKKILDIESVKSEIVPATLEYLFEQYKNKMFILEIKDIIEKSEKEVFIKVVDELISLIDKYNMKNRVIVASFDDEVIEKVREKSNNEIMTSAGINESIKFVKYSLLRIDFFYRPKDAVLILPVKQDLSEYQLEIERRIPKIIRNHVIQEVDGVYYTDIVKSFIVNDAHRHNMAVFYWTVNDKEEMKKLVELGVDGIITDRPDILLELYEELGLK